MVNKTILLRVPWFVFNCRQFKHLLSLSWLSSWVVWICISIPSILWWTSSLDPFRRNGFSIRIFLWLLGWANVMLWICRWTFHLLASLDESRCAILLWVLFVSLLKQYRFNLLGAALQYTTLPFYTSNIFLQPFSFLFSIIFLYQFPRNLLVSDAMYFPLLQ